MCPPANSFPESLSLSEASEVGTLASMSISGGTGTWRALTELLAGFPLPAPEVSCPPPAAALRLRPASKAAFWADAAAFWNSFSASRFRRHMSLSLIHISEPTRPY